MTLFRSACAAIEHFREFDAESDEAAIAYAEDALGNRPMELWCQHRKVMHWDGKQPLS